MIEIGRGRSWRGDSAGWARTIRPGRSGGRRFHGRPGPDSCCTRSQPCAADRTRLTPPPTPPRHTPPRGRRGAAGCVGSGAGQASGEGEQPLGLPSSGRVLGAGAAAVAQLQVGEFGRPGPPGGVLESSSVMVSGRSVHPADKGSGFRPRPHGGNQTPVGNTSASCADLSGTATRGAVTRTTCTQRWTSKVIRSSFAFMTGAIAGAVARKSSMVCPGRIRTVKVIRPEVDVIDERRCPRRPARRVDHWRERRAGARAAPLPAQLAHLEGLFALGDPACGPARIEARQADGVSSSLTSVLTLSPNMVLLGNRLSFLETADDYHPRHQPVAIGTADAVALGVGSGKCHVGHALAAVSLRRSVVASSVVARVTELTVGSPPGCRTRPFP